MRARRLRTRCSAAPRHTTIIATSREPLHVAGEQTYPLQTLSLPEPSASAEAMGALRGGAALRRAGPATAARLRIDRGPCSRGRRSCASTSTAFRWRWNWRLPAFAPSRSSRSTRVCTIASSCSRAETARRCRASRRCAPRSTGATTCSPKTSAPCCGGWRSFPAASPSKPRPRSLRTRRSTNSP